MGFPRFSLSIIVLSLLSVSLWSQTTAYVIAPNGLKVRSSPSLAGDVVGGLAFGEQVAVVDKATLATDTLYRVKNTGNYYTCINGTEYFGNGTMPIMGIWIEVLYKDKPGYVVDNYVFDNRPNVGQTATLYFDRHNTTLELTFNPKQYNWYALITSGDKVYLMASQPDFISQCNEFSGQVITPIFDNMNASIGLIGTKSLFEEKAIDAASFDLGVNAEPGIGGKFVKSTAPELTDGLGASADFQIYAYTTSNGASALFRCSQGRNAPTKVKFIGDLDGDDMMDYIIQSISSDDSTEAALYLSTDRENGLYVMSASSHWDVD